MRGIPTILGKNLNKKQILRQKAIVAVIPLPE